VDGTIRYVSSAYLQNLLPGIMGCRSEAQMIKAAGPIAEPWTMPALMFESVEVLD